MSLLRSISFSAFLTIAVAWSHANAAPLQRVSESTFGKMPDGTGTALKLFTLHNANGMTAKVITYGAILNQYGKENRTAGA